MYLNPYGSRHLSDGFNITKLNFTWEIVHFKNRTVLVQLEFNDANYISTGDKPDLFFFRVKNNHTNLFYSDKIGAEINPDYYNLTFPVPPQAGKSTSSEWILWLAQQIKTTLKVVFWSCVFANFFFAGSLDNFFTFIRTL